MSGRARRLRTKSRGRAGSLSLECAQVYRRAREPRRTLELGARYAGLLGHLGSACTAAAAWNDPRTALISFVP